MSRAWSPEPVAAMGRSPHRGWSAQRPSVVAAAAVSRSYTAHVLVTPGELPAPALGVLSLRARAFVIVWSLLSGSGGEPAAFSGIGGGRAPAGRAWRGNVRDAQSGLVGSAVGEGRVSSE